MKLSEELTWRGFVNQTTYKDINELDKQTVTFYWGVDPSSDSMTIGNLAAAMMVKCFMKYGHKPILLVGGATGLIGDPDGKAQERDLLTLEQVNKNKQAIAGQYKQIFGGHSFELVDNYDWFKDINYLEFLRDTGKHVPMRQMLGRDFVQARLGENANGISYAEFSYVLIQAYDFLYLSKNKGVSLQLCGADQWGNSIAGVELIRRQTGKTAHVYSSPLVVNKTSGKKFGKSEEGAIWLDANKTSPYKFYQFWLGVDDESVEEYLKTFTELDKSAVEDIIKEFTQDRASRIAQKTLAYEVTKLIHGEELAKTVKQASEVLFSGNQPSRADFAILKQELPTIKVDNLDLVDILVQSGLSGSKSEANRFIKEGSVYVNNQRASAMTASTLLSSSLKDQTDSIVKRGKNSFVIISQESTD